MAMKGPGPLGRRTGLRAFWVRNFAPLQRFLAATSPRLLDWLLAVILLLTLAPFLVLRAILAYARDGRVFERKALIGRYREPFEELRFAGPAPGAALPVLFNILRGDLAFAGPRPLSEPECRELPPQGQVRFIVRPGLVSPYSLRRKIGIAHDAEYLSDSDFVYGESLRGNLGLVLRGSLAGVLEGESGAAPPMLDFFSIPIVNTTMDEAVTWMLGRVAAQHKAQIAFVNPDCLNIAYRNAEYHQVLTQATRVLPDGIGIHLGCRILGTSLLANVNGTDLFPRLCEQLAASPAGALYLLGAQPGIAELTAGNMQERYPGLRIAGVQHGFFAAEEEDAVIERINSSGADILLVAFGAPRQELWLARHRERLAPTVVMGVGGLFDFYSGRISRAPQWMREIGLEWVWRLLQEPGRMWRRYVIGNPLFLYRVWRQACGRDGSGGKK